MGRRLYTNLNHFVAMSALVVLGIVLSSAASAYPVPVDYNGNLMRWDISDTDPNVTYGLDGSAADVAAYQAAVDNAAQLWNGVQTSYFRYEPVATGGSPQVTVHLVNALSGASDAAGYTEFDQYNGSKPQHCSIYVQVDNGVSYYDDEKTFLHEFGHGLGLGHSQVPHAIMSYSLEKNEFALDLDDEAAASGLYPADGSQPHLPAGCSVGAGVGSGRSVWLWFGFGLPLVIAIFHHRRPHLRPKAAWRA